MKKSFSALSILFILLSILTVSSCKKDPCKKVDCNNGTCIDGDCVCNPGFMGAACNLLDPCHNVNCNDGTCVNGTCDCDPGYSGTNCTDYDPCFNITCATTGTCLNGVCDCDPGYTGTDCSIQLISAYTGTYNAGEVCSSDPSFTDYYVAEVKTSPTGPQYMYITNLYNHFSATHPGLYQPTDTQVEAVVTTTGITIAPQFWTAAGLEDFMVTGTGTVLNGTTFTVSFRLTDTSSGDFDECVVTYTLQ